MQVTAIIVAAGEGTRMGGSIPKTYLPIAGRPLILRTLDRVFCSRRIGKAIVAVAKKDIPRCKSLIEADPNLSGRVWALQAGGRSRQESVRRGLEELDEDCEVVVIHDGARPFISPSLIDRCVEEAYRVGAVVIGLPVKDTIKVVSEQHWVQATPCRETLREIQTPQAFRKDIILDAHRLGGRPPFDATDDAALVEHMGKPVLFIPGEPTNIKITVPEDVLLAEALVREGRVS